MGHHFFNGLFLKLSVEHPDAEVQICGKSDPKKIGDLQPCGGPVDFFEREDHPDDQCPQREKPEKRKGKVLKIKEDNVFESTLGTKSTIQM